MVLGLDIDGVVADFLSPFLRVVEKKIGNGPIPPETITDFNFKDHPYLTEEAVWKCMEAVSYDPDFWQRLSPLLSAEQWQELDNLSRKEQLVFITHRYERETYDIHEVTCDWLKRHGVGKPVVYFTQESKAKLVDHLGVSLFVDDRHENCRDVAENTRAIVMMPHRHYNQSFDHPKVKRIWNFNELFSYFP
ncbi:MAG: hypothetical protein AAB222_02150 [Candidatus Binatota bacterium]